MRKCPAQHRKGLSVMKKSLIPGLLIVATLAFSLAERGVEASTQINRAPLSAAVSAKSFDDFVAAIHQHESDGRVGRIYGDGGRSYGPLQISYKAWRDALKFDRSIGGKYADCSSLEYSKKVMWGYLQQHDSQALAR